MRRPAAGSDELHSDINKLAIKELDSVGYLQIPSKCPTCKSGSLMMNPTKQATCVEYRCNEDSCRAHFSALSFSTVLPANAGRGLTPAKIKDAIKIYTSAGIKKPASPEAAAKQLDCGRKPVTRLFAALRAKEAALGERLNARTKLKTNVEVDGHRLRTGRISAKQAHKLYPRLVEEWQKNHKNEPLPKYWLMPLIVLGAWERGSDKSLLAPGRLKLSAPSSKPGTEGLEEVRGAAFFDKVKRNSVVFPDGAVSWLTVATEAGKGLRVASVVHQKQQFIYKDRQAKVRGASRWRGTQVIDRRWEGMDTWIGNPISTLIKARPNPQLMQAVRSFQWRVRQRDVYKQLGAACKSSMPQ
jgi:hypothetical protein